MPTITRTDVLARYGGYYQGSDDLTANCLILADGRCVRVFQGIDPVAVSIDRAGTDAFERLLELLESPIPADWTLAPYEADDANFLPSPNEAGGGEVVVHGTQAGGIPRYYVAPDGSDLAQVVKRIAAIDAPAPSGQAAQVS